MTDIVVEAMTVDYPCQLVVVHIRQLLSYVSYAIGDDIFAQSCRKTGRLENLKRFLQNATVRK